MRPPRDERSGSAIPVRFSVLAHGVSELRRIARTGAWILKRAWAASPTVTLTLAAVVVILGLLPAGLALAMRGLINAAAAAVSGRDDPLALLLPWLALALAVALVDALAPLASKLLLQALSDDLSLEVTTDVLRHAAVMDLTSLQDPRLRDTIESVKHDAAAAFARLTTGLQGVCADIIQVTFMVVILTYIEPWVLLVAGPFAVPYLVIRWRTSKVRGSEDVAWATKRRWTHYFTLHLTGHVAPAETKMLGLGPLFLAQLRALLSEFRDRDRRRYRRDFLDSGIFAGLTTLGFYALFVRIALRAGHGVLTVGDIAVFAAVTARLRLGLEHLIWSLSIVAEQAAWIANLRAFLDMAPRIRETGTSVPVARHGELEIVGVSFTYPHATTPAVSDVSLHIKPGEVVALVGENGAGKTTFVRLIARLYDPDRGSIRLDGVDLRDWPLQELHNSIAFLDQRFGRYEATAAENIAYGDWRRLLEQRERVREIAVMADADKLIRGMPQGYDTRLGPMFGTHDLSTGQWQKLAVARAVARNAPLLIIDEPTAHLDAAAEYEIFCRLRDLAHGRTTILVSHQFTTLGLADRIAVMDKGRLVETGTHDELIAHGGVYARLYDLSRRQAVRKST